MHEATRLVTLGIPKTVQATPPNVDVNKHGAKHVQVTRFGRHSTPGAVLTAMLAAAALTVPCHARAVDGCVVLLCLAAPNWRAISECVPPVRQLFRDLARGKPFPSCAMAGAGNSSSHAWASAPSNCPQQYTRINQGPNGPIYNCDYTGAIAVTVQGMPFTRTWWSFSGDSVTEYSSAAKSQLGSWDTRFDDEYAAWLVANPAPVVP